MSLDSNQAAAPTSKSRPPVQPPHLGEPHATAIYANFCRVLGTPEEVIVDFGLNPQPFDATGTIVPLSQRIVLSYFTAKRLLQALQTSIARHEAVFGAIETSVTKRAEHKRDEKGQA